MNHDSIDITATEYAARGWDGVEQMTAAMSIMRAQDIIRSRYADVLKPFDLTFPRYEALALLFFSESGSLPLSKTSSTLNTHPASITYTIDRLEERGLVSRSPHPVDRRTTIANITKEGRRVCQKATKAIITASHGLAGLDHRDLVSIIEALEPLRASAPNTTDPAG
jgi:DNA-binding MarR family transcriptional regulator